MHNRNRGTHFYPAGAYIFFFNCQCFTIKIYEYMFLCSYWLTDFENILGYIYTSSGPHFSFEMDNLFSTSKEAITTYVYLKHSKENLFTGIAAPR